MSNRFHAVEAQKPQLLGWTREWLLCMGLFSEKAGVEFIPADDTKGPERAIEGEMKRGRKISS